MLTLAIATALLVTPEPARSDRDGGGSSDRPRFELTRTAGFLFRIDTATGQVWSALDSGDGGWQVMGAPPELQSEAGRAGVFGLVVLSSGRRGGLGGSPPEAQLLRTDRATGRAWLAPAKPDGAWIAIAEAQSPAQ